MAPVNTPECHVCGAETSFAGTRYGKVAKRDFVVAQCRACWFSFIVDPWLDFNDIYNDAYYRGKGADPLTDYVNEAENAHRSIRRLEWRGIHGLISELVPLNRTTSILDFGCGAGGFVEFMRSVGYVNAFGYEESWSLERLRERGTPVLDRATLEGHYATYDVITAIEVIEHVPDPVGELKFMRQLLRPGGLLLLTTGNAQPYRDSIAKWRYLIPEIHVSVFEPGSLERALQAAGFESMFPGFRKSWRSIIRYKILKNANRKYSSRLDALLPWFLITRLADRVWRFSAHPVGRVPSGA